MKHAFFVDLPNFYSQITSSILATPSEWRNYFTEWFDFDRLASRVTSQSGDVWVFHSNKIGSKEAQISDSYLVELVKRFNSQKGVTARNVNIKGTQREFADSVCSQCSGTTSIESKSEKGIDTSLVVHLFDTADSWDVAHLLSGDADFVPAVAALRRRGKIVNGIGIPSRASDALIRECFQYSDLVDQFLLDDLRAYRFCRKQGIAWKFLHDIALKPRCAEKNIWVKFQRFNIPNIGNVEYRLMSSENRDEREWSDFSFHQFRGSSVHHEEFSSTYPHYYKFEFDDFFGPRVDEHLKRVLQETPFSGYTEHLTVGGWMARDIEMVYWWNPENDTHEIVYPDQLAELGG